MEKALFDPVADILLGAYLATAAHSREFQDEYEQPPTSAEKVHYMRSVTQAEMNRSDGQFVLAQPYVEFGRVEFKDTDSGHRFLLRSEGMVRVERATRGQVGLFDAVRYLQTDVVLLVYRFHPTGLDLSVAGAVCQRGRSRLEASGVPTYVGTWQFESTGPSGPSPQGTRGRVGPALFDQGAGDPFEDLGPLDDFGEEGDAG